ncbi:alpha-galactosidase [Azospirillum agricola]|uniref:family 4 glycosyl hydrolase n=1 Tax=Azospirillum agricola TaxID=1720247 RepID=UPI001AE75B15|nr:alpha-glucosidase/alpha-galactosidase [Azospirillum agricola]MBP2231025.1 alpha-galactosidase [Azospirillum agricola]
MANVTKIVFIGAGSAAFGLSLFQDLFSSSELAGSTLTLVDTNPDALVRMAALADVLNRRGNAGLVIETATDRKAALEGAGFVLCAVAVDRNRLWRLDFEVPRKHGVRHTLGENGGPGGLFFTLRTLPLIVDIARDVEAICPDALFINLSNPESRIVLGLSRCTGVRALGLCHGIFLARWFVCQILGMPEKEVDVWGAGLNHFQWLTAIRERATGRDLYPLLREREALHDPAFTPLTRRLFRAFGLWVTCSDDHVGEYLPYGWEGGEHGFDFENDERGRVILKDLMDGVIDGSKPIPDDWTGPSWGERAVAVIEGMLHNRKRFIESGIVVNRGVVPGLPDELAVEVPLVADAAGVHPVALGRLPDGVLRLLSVQAGVQQMAVEAALRGSRELALQALLIDPVITSTDAAVAILDELWEVNRPYIRPCL